MKRKLLIFLVAITALASGVVAKRYLLPVLQFQPETKRLPAFSYPDLAGKQHAISEWQGKVLLINFWATWCPPCRKEIPDLISVHNEFSAKGFSVIGIANDDAYAVGNYLKTIKISYPILIAPNESTALTRQLGNFIDAVPFSVIVDRKGNIVLSQPGELSKAKIIEAIKPLL